jgi:putative Mg2+ transporter-C (MgtC) family protein
MVSVAPAGDPLDVLLRLVAAVLCGGMLGFNREVRRKPAGLRTHALVSLGAAAVTTTMLGLSVGPAGLDPNPVSRVIQGVVTGIGFVGGGAILRDVRGGSIRGLTTAATIWVATVLGIACGAGEWPTTLIVAVLAIVTLVAGRWADVAVHRWLVPTQRERSRRRTGAASPPGPGED